MRLKHKRALLILVANALSFCAMVSLSARSMAGPQLPVPCVATSCGTGVKGFVTSGSASAVQSGNTLSVSQTSNNATLNWSSFNIGASGKVVFVQPSSTSIALNRIFDSNPSSIFGTLSANGQVYLINANGFLFGNGATVNVGGLLASSLNLTDANFTSGILVPALSGQSALQPFVDGAGNVLSQNITVQAGAQLTAADGGRLLLAAPNVTNGGSLSAPDGQVILAAGQTLYLQASGQADLRGLVVEVDGGGTAANQLAGNISAPRGNVTLTGLMVNQDGRVSATTSVNANGSIVLQAADTLPPNFGAGVALSATHGGTVDLGPGSLTEVLPEYADTTTAVAAQAQLPSQINISGEQVLMHAATIDAPSGMLTVTAGGSDYVSPGATSNSTNPPAGIQSTADPNAQIRIDAGTSINLAGSDAELPMDANLVTLQLRSNEFADDPTQRGGPLQSTPNNTVTVTVDVRADNGLGTPIADVSSAIAAVGQTIAQRTEAGGSAQFESNGDVVFSPSASINVSGGYTTYLGGSIQTTKLIGANGQLYDIGSANPLLSYTGVVNPTFTQSYDKWGIQEVIPTPGLSTYESTYVQGANAGSVQFAAPSLALAGGLLATSVNGPYQRSAPSAGGTLIIGAPVATPTTIDYLAPSVSFATTPTPIVVADGAPLPATTVQLPTSYLASDGFTSTTIYSNTSIGLPAGLPLTLAPGASLSLIAPRIDVDSNITAIGGSLSFENVASIIDPTPTGAPAPNTPRAGIGIGEGVTLDVSGQWTNDGIPADGIGLAPIYASAGTINLQLTVPQSELVLGDYVSLKANGGAWLETGGTVSYGKGGTITLDASPAQSALQFGQSLSIQGFATGTAAGGTFNLLAPRLELSQGSGSDWTQAQRVDDLTNPGQVLELYAPLFTDDGFANVKLTATGAVESYATSDVLTVASGTIINAETSTLALDPNYLALPTGTPISRFTQVNLLPSYDRPVTSLAFNVLREADDQVLGNTAFGTLDVQAGASILAGPGGTIALSGEGGVTVAGTLGAPGGKITISIPSPAQADPNDSSGVTDPGFVPTLGIDVASTATVDVAGTTIMTPNAQGLLSGTVLPGGTVTLAANRGTVTTEAGSLITIQGTSATLDVPISSLVAGDLRETVASVGGALNVSAPESISLLGTLHAQAGVGTSGSAAGGSLEVDLVRGGGSVVLGTGPGLPAGTLNMDLVESTAGNVPSSSSSNQAILGAQQLADSGIASLTLRSGGEITTDAVSLSLAQQLALDSPSFVVEASSSLTAPYVQIGNSLTADFGGAVPTSSAGSGSLTVAAQQLNLLGNFAVTSAANVTFRSAGDVQLEGIAVPDSNGPVQGSITTSGNLTIEALRVYPDTYTDFMISSLEGSGGTVNLGSTGPSPGAPLSADGKVTISADNISITGTLLAPFGSIDLTANHSLTLASGSLVSVSGAGLDVPFGETQLNQGEWIYNTTNAEGYGSVNQITSVPTKQISLSAPAVNVQTGATANITGGGDLYAYEWVPGTGGTYDNLNAVGGASASNTALSSIPNLYAIIPAAKGQAGPYDPEESTQAVPGQTIYLSGGAGIAAGYYALLPPRYALSSGAVLIQLEPNIVSAGGGQISALANGTPVIAGYLSTGNTGLHTSGVTEYEGVAVYPSGYAQELAAYTISNASSYFSAIATLAGTGPVAEPADAGTFSLTVTPASVNSLNLQGSVLTAAASGGRGAEIDISAPDLEITGTSAASDGSIQVSGSVLQSWNASSLTLGGVASSLNPTTTVSTATSSTVTNNTGIAVEASNITVDSGVQLTADQIELVAQQAITVEAGASLESSSGKTEPLKSLPSLSNVILTDTAATPNALFQAALLSVSDLTLPVVCRSNACLGTTGINVPATASASPPANATLTIASGATLSSGGALVADAPGDVSLAGTLNGKGASWSLSSSSIAFVGSGTSPDTLNIGSGLLADLQQAGAVRLASLGDIDIAAPISLGVAPNETTPILSALTLVANSIDNHGAGNTVFGAAALTFGGNVAPDPANPPAAAVAGNGNLMLIANSFTLGAGVLAVNGFAQTTAQIAGIAQTEGAGYLNVGGNLTVNAVELSPAPSATDTTVIAGGPLSGQPGPLTAQGSTLATTGTLTLGAPTLASAGSTPVALVGGSLTLTANAIQDAGAIVAPSGMVTLESAGDLHLASTASIDAAGSTLTAATQTAASPGGLVTLTAGGNLTLDAGSVVSVAGGAAAPAGTLVLSAINGNATVAGNLNGAAPGNTGGTLDIEAGTLSGGLASLVANMGIAGFSDSLNVRVRNGDLDLAAGSALTANSITLTADSGLVDIAGVLSAPSAAQRGLIDLSAGVGVTLEATGQLHADATGSSGRGGEIDLNAVTADCTAIACGPSGSITLDPGSVITTNGKAQMGELVLRAPALTQSDDVAINQGLSGLGANVNEVGEVIIEPVLVTPTASSTVNGDLANAVSNATTYLSAATPTILSRLTNTSATPLLVQAGVELQDTSAGDLLTLQSFDLSSNSTNGQVVNVAVLAAGGITLNGTISDGFVNSGNAPTTLTNLPSGSLTFVAGADLSSANPLSVLPLSAFAVGSVPPALVLGPQSIVRTGTGDIDLAAAGDIEFQYGTDGIAAAVYTGGLAGTAAVTTGTGKNRVQENFPTDGGNVQLTAGVDVVGAPLTDVNPNAGNYSVTGWLVRGTAAAPATGSSGSGTPSATMIGTYGIDFDTFEWDVGALGGGDVTVSAGGQVSNLSAATAASSPDGNSTVYGAGGGLRVTSVGDIGSAQVYVADGVGTLTTNGGLTPILYDSDTGSLVGSSIALASAQVSVWSRQSVQIEAVYNPTIIPAGVSGQSKGFFTYAPNSALAVSSTDGDVTLNSEPTAGPQSVLLGHPLLNQPGSAELADLPANLSLHALQQNVAFNGNAILFPSSTGQLDLFAGIDIVGNGELKMGDGATVPTAADASLALATNGLQTGGLLPFQDAIHVGDTQPALITAGRDIDDLYLYVPKAAQISAGRDITNLLYQGQNTAPSDTTVISSGRDITYTGTTGEISVGGPGSVDVFAARNVNLGLSDGIFTTGNLADANLPTATGADLTLAVGYGTTGADFSSFLTTIIEPNAAYQAQLESYVESQTGTSNLGLNQAVTAFDKLAQSQQSTLIDDVFFNELLLSGRAANSGTGVGFAQGYAAINALYPGSRDATASNPNPYSGSLNLVSSQIYTLSGGNISILVPGGDIDVGLAFTPVGVIQKSPGSLGIVAEGAGNIDIYSEGDVNVNASRIFTLGGGNILIWSDEGSIDAGNGSKSSLSVPPPTVLVNADGSVTIDYSGSLSGSGIRTIQTDPDVPAGDVDLDAPVGTVNAGDAGIGAAGNINIAAAHVIGALNINFGGTATGVPSDLSGLAASLSGVSAVGAGATNSSTNQVADNNETTKETAPLAQSALSWLEVFVTGLGEENCKQDDRECLARQKKAAGQ
jgi:filamentous hemagglutinin family protein